MISSSSSAAVNGSLRIPKSSMMRSGTVGEQFHVLLAVAVQCGVPPNSSSRMLRFPIQHAIALLEDGVPDGLGAVTFAASSWAKKKCVFPTPDPCGSASRKRDYGSSLIELESNYRVACLGHGIAPAVAPLSNGLLHRRFVGDQDGDQIDGSH